MVSRRMADQSPALAGGRSQGRHAEIAQTFSWHFLLHYTTIEENSSLWGYLIIERKFVALKQVLKEHKKKYR